MIRVYFMIGNRLKSRLFPSANGATESYNRSRTLEITRRETATVEEEGLPTFWPWSKPKRVKRKTSNTYIQAGFAKGEWLRWEWEAKEPEKKEKKDAKDPEVRT